MSSVVRRVLAEFGFKDAGFTAGLNQASSAVGRFSTESVLGTKVGGNLAGTIANVGKTFAATALATAGLTGGVAGLALAMNRALGEVGEMQMSMLKLRLAVGGNAQAFAELQGIISSAPRGLLFDDNDVARALAVAKTLDMTNDEIKVLLPSLRGMAAVMGQDLSEATQQVAIAIETGMVRSLRQYGITQADVDKKAREYYGAELKDLDEVAKRWTILNTVLDKSKLFEEGEREALNTLPGALRAISTELGELLEQAVTPEADAFLRLLQSIEKESIRSREQGTPPVAAPGMFGLANTIMLGVGATPLLAPTPYGPQTLAEYEAGLGDVYGPVLPPGGIRRPQPNQALARLRERLQSLQPEPFAFTGIEELEGEQSSQSRRRLAAKRLDLLRTQAEEERELAAVALQERLEMEESMERASWEARAAIATDISVGMYNAVSRASLAYYMQEGNRRKSFLHFLGATVKQEAAQYIMGLGLKAAQEAAFHAIRGFASLLNPIMAPKAAGEFAAAAKYTAFATAAGVASAALNASAAGAFRQGEAEVDRGGGIRGGEDRASTRAFGLTFTRPVENLTIQVIVTINQDVGMYGTGHHETIRDLIEKEALPAIQDLADTGQLRTAA